MKAAVCYEFGQPLRVEDVEIDAPRRGEGKVGLAATGICHSDVHLVRVEWGGELPVVAGHEAAGVVEEVGDDVTLTQPGDRVVVSLIRSCGRCFFCATGSPQQCEGTFALQTESRLHTRRGDPLHQGLRTAAFAEYTIVDQSQVVPVPDDMPLDRAALLACGVITGVGAVVNIARVTPGSSVVVIGSGGIGLNAVQGAVLAGAQPIIALDVLDTKLTAAQAFGATHTVNAGQADARAVVKDLTGGRGADYVFGTVGSPKAVAQGLTLVRREGTVGLVGIPERGASVPLEIARFVIDGKRVVGCLMG